MQEKKKTQRITKISKTLIRENVLGYGMMLPAIVDCVKKFV